VRPGKEESIEVEPLMANAKLKAMGKFAAARVILRSV
jgi:hypothetical protein